MSLKEYRRKRDPKKTSEPFTGKRKGKQPWRHSAADMQVKNVIRQRRN